VKRRARKDSSSLCLSNQAKDFEDDDDDGENDGADDGSDGKLPSLDALLTSLHRVSGIVGAVGLNGADESDESQAAEVAADAGHDGDGQVAVHRLGRLRGDWLHDHGCHGDKEELKRAFRMERQYAQSFDFSLVLLF